LHAGYRSGDIHASLFGDMCALHVDWSSGGIAAGFVHCL
jgi:hypothetical protein